MPNQATEEEAAVPEDGTRIVRNLSQDFFRRRLIEHFDILWSKNEVVWPRSVRK